MEAECEPLGKSQIQREPDLKTCRISIVIPTRNRLEKLRRALASIEQQTFRDYEVWLVDDGSTDGTRGFIDPGQLARTYPNIPSIHTLLNERSCGAAAARNQALARAQGELIAFLDDDDVWFPNYLQQQLMQLDGHPKAAACCARHVEFDSGGSSHRPDTLPLFEGGDPLIHLLTDSFVHTMSIFMCRRAAFDSIGMFDEKLSIVHDWDWYARLLLSGNSILTPAGPALAGHEVPGGLVERHRAWYAEEQAVLDRIFASNRQYSARQRQVRAHRALVFARIGLSRRDYVFALRRLMEAFSGAPLHSLRAVALRLLRNCRSAISREPSSHTRSPLSP